MTLRDLKPATRVARVLPMVEAIKDARLRGITWVQITAEIGAQVGIDSTVAGAANAMRAAYRSACRQMEKGRLAAPPAAAPVRPVISPATQGSETTKTEAGKWQSNKDFLASLPQIGGDK